MYGIYSSRIRDKLIDWCKYLEEDSEEMFTASYWKVYILYYLSALATIYGNSRRCSYDLGVRGLLFQ